MFEQDKKRVLKKVVLHGLALVALAAVFVTYIRPDFLVSMADQLWSCF
jgi:hypothetical protein